MSVLDQLQKRLDDRVYPTSPRMPLHRDMLKLTPDERAAYMQEAEAYDQQAAEYDAAIVLYRETERAVERDLRAHLHAEHPKLTPAQHEQLYTYAYREGHEGRDWIQVTARIYSEIADIFK